MESTNVPKMSYAPFIIGGAILVVIAVVLYFMNIEISIFLATIFGAGFIGYKVK
jgi:hypothetical protein